MVAPGEPVPPPAAADKGIRKPRERQRATPKAKVEEPEAPAPPSWVDLLRPLD
jgi:hypothetical protein